jgi:hypothetical protein
MKSTDNISLTLNLNAPTTNFIQNYLQTNIPNWNMHCSEIAGILISAERKL